MKGLGAFYTITTPCKSSASIAVLTELKCLQKKHRVKTEFIMFGYGNFYNGHQWVYTAIKERTATSLARQ